MGRNSERKAKEGSLAAWNQEIAVVNDTGALLSSAAWAEVQRGYLGSDGDVAL